MSASQQKSKILFVTLGEVCEDIRRLGGMMSDGFRQEAEVSTIALDGMESQICLQEVPNLVKRVSPQLLISAFSQSWHGGRPAALLDSVRRSSWRGPLLTLLTDPSSESVAAVREAGADEVFSLPISTSFLLPRIGHLLHRKESRGKSNCPVTGPLAQLVGESSPFRAILEKIPILAACDATVLVTGDTGTGKGLVAAAIHALSPRRDRTCVCTQCGALPERLVENELFGHAAGAYTDASSTQKGLVEEAEGGTLFLDEIDALPVSTQSKLLSLIQDKCFRPLGSGKTLKANIRIIAASNADLESLVKEGKFRADLFHRLNVVPLHLPKLSERLGDIPRLVRHFLEKHNGHSQILRTVTPAAMALLQRQPWPGNVRELENLIERALILSQGIEIGPDNLGLSDVPVPKSSLCFADAKAQAVADFEVRFIKETLASHQGNVTQAAKAAGKDRRSFIRLMQKHNLR